MSSLIRTEMQHFNEIRRCISYFHGCICIPEDIILQWQLSDCYVIKPFYSKFKKVLICESSTDIHRITDFCHKNEINYMVIDWALYVEDEGCVTLINLVLKDIDFIQISFKELVQPFFNFAEKHNIRLRYADDVCA